MWLEEKAVWSKLHTFPPVGWQSIWEQLPQSTTVCAWLKTVLEVRVRVIGL